MKGAGHYLQIGFEAGPELEGQGTLVEEEAFVRAEQECEADADKRAELRARAEAHRAMLDREYIADFEQHLRALFPGCPSKEAQQIAERACLKYSGRVGRSAEAKKFEPEAIHLAVVAHVRHQHTSYDDLLMQGWDRHEARTEVARDIDTCLAAWSSGDA